jgi:hypothetical protein
VSPTWFKLLDLLICRLTSCQISSIARRSNFTTMNLERTIQQAVDAKEIPGCVLVSSNRDGTSPAIHHDPG